MSKRVYEIARELNLSSKQVIERLNAAGIEVKSHLAVVQDPVVERECLAKARTATPRAALRRTTVAPRGRTSRPYCSPSRRRRGRRGA